MRDYLQPDFYKFGSDSIELVQFISENIDLKNKQALEIGTGCGVISIELAQKEPSLCIDAIEPQIDFKEYYSENAKLFGDNQVTFYHASIETFLLENEKHYDFIFFNPPYFWHGESRAAEDERRDLCRRIEKDKFVHWFKLLEGRGEVLLCCRDREIIEKLDCWQIKRCEKKLGCHLFYLRYI